MVEEARLGEADLVSNVLNGSCSIPGSGKNLEGSRQDFLAAPFRLGVISARPPTPRFTCDITGRCFSHLETLTTLERARRGTRKVLCGASHLAKYEKPPRKHTGWSVFVLRSLSMAVHGGRH
jgi:hypothetical protein